MYSSSQAPRVNEAMIAPIVATKKKTATAMGNDRGGEASLCMVNLEKRDLAQAVLLAQRHAKVVPYQR